MSRRDKNGMSMGVLVVLVTIAAVLCIALGTLMYLDNKALIRNEEDNEKITQEQAKSYVKQDGSDDMGEDSSSGTEQGEISGENAFYESLLPTDKEIDITQLQSTVNPDIYAWLYIPDTGIDEALLQHPEDGFYYLTHNSKGEDDENGALFTQLFNSRDFSDNVTVIYGHNGENDTGFSRLKLFADPEFFKSHPYIFVYTKDAVLLYETFAAYESDDKLIVMFYQTADDDMYHIYLERLEEIAGISSNLNKEHWPAFSDKILTLSTGVTGKADRRFLVQARFVGGFIEDGTDE